MNKAVLNAAVLAFAANTASARMVDDCDTRCHMPPEELQTHEETFQPHVDKLEQVGICVEVKVCLPKVI